MPVLNGYDTAKRPHTSGREDAKFISIIVTTANGFSDEISAALSASKNAHISKPIDIQLYDGS